MALRALAARPRKFPGYQPPSLVSVPSAQRTRINNRVPKLFAQRRDVEQFQLPLRDRYRGRPYHRPANRVQGLDGEWNQCVPSSPGQRMIWSV